MATKKNRFLANLIQKLSGKYILPRTTIHGYDSYCYKFRAELYRIG